MRPTIPCAELTLDIAALVARLRDDDAVRLYGTLDLPAGPDRFQKMLHHWARLDQAEQQLLLDELAQLTTTDLRMI